MVAVWICKGFRDYYCSSVKIEKICYGVGTDTLYVVVLYMGATPARLP